MDMKPSMDIDFDIKRNLIVNYLPPNFTQDDVKILFNRVAPVTNCKLIKNHENGQSLGYAFIEFSTEKSAADAIVQINGTRIEGKTLRVNYARQSSPEIKDSNIYIAGLPKWVNEEKLLSMFSSFGNVITHKLLLGTDHTSRGVGFVRYALKSEAQNAIEAMSGKILPESTNALTVKLAIPPASKQKKEPSLGNTSLSMLGRTSIRFNPLAASNTAILNQSPIQSPPLNLSTDVMSQQPLNYFGASNSIGSSSMAGIVQARQNLSSQIFSLYVYGLQATHTELTLYELFAPFGSILNVKLIRDLTKEEKPCKGFGFVNFRKYEEAYSALLTMNGCPFEGKSLQVSFKSNRQGGGTTPDLSAIHHPTQNHTFSVVPF